MILNDEVKFSSLKNKCGLDLLKWVTILANFHHPNLFLGIRLV